MEMTFTRRAFLGGATALAVWRPNVSRFVEEAQQAFTPKEDSNEK